MIKVELENTEELKKWGLGLEKTFERCHFCKTQTRYWYKKTNTPVCKSCAANKSTADIKK